MKEPQDEEKNTEVPVVHDLCRTYRTDLNEEKSDGCECEFQG